MIFLKLSWHRIWLDSACACACVCVMHVCFNPFWQFVSYKIGLFKLFVFNTIIEMFGFRFTILLIILFAPFAFCSSISMILLSLEYLSITKYSIMLYKLCFSLYLWANIFSEYSRCKHIYMCVCVCVSVYIYTLNLTVSILPIQMEYRYLTKS